MNKLPNGLIYLENFITSDEEEFLIENIDCMPWDTKISRRRQQYGFPYDIGKKKLNTLEQVPPIPKWLDDTISIKLYDLKYMPQLAEQVIINEYLPGQGIAAHTDSPVFGPVVVSVSLLSPVVMEFIKYANSNRTRPAVLGDSYQYYNLVLQPRSALILTDEARYQWQHKIGQRYTEIIDDKVVERTRRVSITLRTLTQNE